MLASLLTITLFFSALFPTDPVANQMPGLKEKWENALLQGLYEHRLQALSEESKARLFYPASGYAPQFDERSGAFLSFALQQVTTLQKEGFSAEEFFLVKSQILSELRTLPTDEEEGSVDVDTGVDCEEFIEASVETLERIQLDDLSSRIPSFLKQEQESLQRGHADSEEEEESSSFLPILSLYFDPTASFYALPISEKEKKIVQSIFTTMAEKNIIQLALEKRAMEKKGKKITHIHPMRFIAYLFANPELKSCMKKISKSSFKWDAFVDGFSKRMKEENGKDNLIKHVPGFCKEVGADPATITRFIEKRDWEGLAKSLL